MFPSVLRILSRTVFVLATTAVFSTSCSRQPEGERCDYQWAGPTQDCDSGLQCTPCGNLQNSVVDRCCRTDNTYSDPRCAPSTAPTQQYCNTHGTASASAGSGNTAGSGTAGSATSGGMSSVGGKAGSSAAGSESSETSGNSGEATAGGGG